MRRSAPSRPTRSLTAILVVVISLACAPAAQADLPQLGIADLLQRADVRMLGQNPMDSAGGSASSAGDVNGDGRPDVIVGARNADNNARADSGSAYVVFGAPGPATLDFRVLGGRGFRIDGAAAMDGAGEAVSGAGDVNGDGLADVIVGAQAASTAGRMDNGAAYVVFGKRNAARVDLSALGGQGFRIDGAADADQAGYSVAGAGDMNGDGRSELIVGAFNPANNGRAQSGSAYVVGKANSATVDLRTLGAQGFRIDGAASGDRAGEAVAGPGDVNGDGRPDVLVGAFENDFAGRSNAGSGYVVFGKASAGNVDLLSLGAQGFRVAGGGGDYFAGDGVGGAGDVNADGLADIVVGARGADDNGRADSGTGYLVFGSRTSTATVDGAALGARGIKVEGAQSGNLLGTSAGRAGDLNGDGLSDVLLGAPAAGNNGRGGSGSGYVIFGRLTPGEVDLAALRTGVRFDGEAAMDQSSISLAGNFDFDGNGTPDIVVGAPGADNGRTDSGAGYVVFGSRPVLRPGVCANVRFGTPRGETVVGTNAGDRLIGQDGNDVLRGLRGRDCLRGGPGNDRLSGGTRGDRLAGGTGNDRLIGARGADRLLGNEGNDRFAGGRDRDRMRGGSGRDRLRGEGGSDRILGGSGNDRLAGARGNDRLDGGSGRDRLDGGSGRDRLFGASGRDLLIGGSGRDRIRGGSGNDRIRAADGRRDRVSCGRGRDRVSADRFDALIGCERVLFP